MMHEYKVEVTREGRWWMINVPEIDQLTQARRITEIVPMAESLIAVRIDFSQFSPGLKLVWSSQGSKPRALRSLVNFLANSSSERA